MKTLWMTLFMLFTSSLMAQDALSGASDFEDMQVRIFTRYTSVNPGPDDPYGGFTINFAWAFNNYEKKRAIIRYENPTLGDAVFLLARLLRGNPTTTESGLEHAYGSGFIGWFQLYKNSVVKSNFAISPGFTLSDYIFGIEQFTATRSRVMYDPAGYFFAGGPSVMFSMPAGKGVMMGAFINYDMCFAKVKYQHATYTAVEGYPKPHFLTLGLEATHRSGIFGSFRINSVVDLGNVGIKANRIDVSVGFHFKGKN